jgi:hypothetical protein
MDLKRLNELLNYNEQTGVFTWNVNRRGYRGIKAGDVAGTVHAASKTSDYKSIRIMVDQQWYEAHRLAWAMHTGSFIPDGMHIDHINGDATDNRIANLRLASHKQNMENVKLHKNNKSGHRGVWWDESRQLWLASMSHEGKQKNLGRYPTKEQAAAAVINARSMLYTHYTGRESQ